MSVGEHERKEGRKKGKGCFKKGTSRVRCDLPALGSVPLLVVHRHSVGMAEDAIIINIISEGERSPRDHRPDAKKMNGGREGRRLSPPPPRFRSFVFGSRIGFSWFSGFLLDAERGGAIDTTRLEEYIRIKNCGKYLNSPAQIHDGKTL